jgi:hypothetical protein|nr:MAG TPA: hypothetical protein [Caudoviricetes sp.]
MRYINRSFAETTVSTPLCLMQSGVGDIDTINILNSSKGEILQ